MKLRERLGRIVCRLFGRHKDIELFNRDEAPHFQWICTRCKRIEQMEWTVLGVSLLTGGDDDTS